MRSLPALLAVLALTACATTDKDTTDDTDTMDSDTMDSDTDDTTTTETDTDDVTPLDVTLSFAALFDGAPFVCGGTYEHVGTADTTVTVKDFRLYVHDVRLIDDAGHDVALTLDDTAWQHDGVVLLDFEDATSSCAEFGSAQTNTVITGTAPPGTYTGVAFTIGVPFALNHVSTATAPAPLNATGMYWVWKSGYKFLRIDLLDDAEPANGWNIHLGAGGCDSPDAMTPPESPCASPNLPEIRITGIDPLTDTLDLDGGALVAAADVSTNTDATPPGCMSSALEPNDCGPVFTALGLDFSTGACANGCDGQTFVTVE